MIDPTAADRDLTGAFPITGAENDEDERPAVTAALARHPRAVWIHNEPDRILLWVEGKVAARAYLDTTDTTTGQWWVQRRNQTPYRVEARWSAELVLGDWHTQEAIQFAARVRPEQGRPDAGDGYYRTGPAGACCVGCGTDLAGDWPVATVTATDGSGLYFICGSCHCYLDDDEDEEGS